MEAGYLYIVLTGLLSGMLVFGGQVFFNLGLSLFQLAFISQLMVVLMLLPFVIRYKHLRPKLERKWLWVFYGFVTAVITFAQYGAVALGASVAITVLLLYTQPLWTIIISRIFFKEKLTKSKLIACVIVLIGMIILVNPFESSKITSPIGVIVALIGGFALSLWVIIGGFVSKNKSPPVTTKFVNSCLTIPFLLLFYFVILNFTKNPTLTNFSFNLSLTMWFALAIFTLFGEVINHLSYFKGVKTVPTTNAGIILLLEPITGALLSVIFLSQALTINILVGGALILLSNYIVIKFAE